jgi:hypothetical protein
VELNEIEKRFPNQPEADSNCLPGGGRQRMSKALSLERIRQIYSIQ